MPLPPPALVQAFKECRYREEWRCMREQQLLELIAGLSLSGQAAGGGGSALEAGSPSQAALAALLHQQVDQVKQVRRRWGDFVRLCSPV